MANRIKDEDERRSEKIQIQVDKKTREKFERLRVKQKKTMSDIGLELLTRGMRYASVSSPKPRVRLSLLATAPCGAWDEAVETAEPFDVNTEVAVELGIKEGDVVVRTNGESMVGAGIPDKSLLIMRCLENRLPQTGDVCLVQVTLGNGDCVGSIKTWKWNASSFHLEDGDAIAFGFPKDAVEVRAVAYKVAIMSKG